VEGPVQGGEEGDGHLPHISTTRSNGEIVQVHLPLVAPMQEISGVKPMLSQTGNLLGDPQTKYGVVSSDDAELDQVRHYCNSKKKVNLFVIFFRFRV